MKNKKSPDKMSSAKKKFSLNGLIISSILILREGPKNIDI